MKTDISVIICTHNPRSDFLLRVLDALRKQTLPHHQWELLLIDNASKENLADKWDLSWHPRARHIREEELGLTPARLRGIKESAGELLVFVDDDNVLQSNYLAESKALKDTKCDVGVWSGSIRPEFEIMPANWKRPLLPYLAINEEDEERVSKDVENAPLPIGAGMIVQKGISVSYVNEIALDKTRSFLGRRGNKLLAGEDTDMGIVAIKQGFACGRTPRLQLIHLIPKRRVATKYLFQIVKDVSYSHALLYRRHGLQRGQISLRELIPKLARVALLAGSGAVSGNADRFGRGLLGILSLYGTWLAMRSEQALS